MRDGPPPTSAEVAADAADNGRFFGLGEIGEREIVGGEMREMDILVSKAFFMANVDRSLFGGLRWKKSKFLWLLV